MSNRSFFPMLWRRRWPALPLLLLWGITIGLLTLLWFTTHLYADENQPDGLGSLAGLVRNDTGQLLAGVQVTLWTATAYGTGDSWTYSRFTHTEADGSYRFGALPPGIYRLSAQDPFMQYGLRFYPSAPTVQEAQDVVIAGNILTAIPLTLQPTGRIIATVRTTPEYTLTYSVAELYQRVRTANGAYWEHLRTTSPVTTNHVYTFTGLTANSYRVCAYGSGAILSAYECYDNVYRVDEGTNITVTPGATSSNVTMVLGDGANYAQIKGRVTAATTDQPLAGTHIYAYRYQEDDFLLATVAHTWEADTVRSIPVANVIMQAVTDANGEYTLATVPAGKYQLQFVDPTGNYAFAYYHKQVIREEAAILEVAAQQVISSVNSRLERGGRISGVVTLADQPTPDTRVLAERKSASGLWQLMAEVKTNPNTGGYTIGGLPAGSYRLSARAEIIEQTNFIYHSLFGIYGGVGVENAQEIPVTSGGSATNINIALSGPRFDGGLSGQITANGQPLVGAKVALYLQNNCCNFLTPVPRLYTVTDDAGNYTFNGLNDFTTVLGVSDPTGRYATTYYSNQVSIEQARLVNIPGDRVLTGYNLDLPLAGALNGVVRRRDNRPVADLYVTFHMVNANLAITANIGAGNRTDADGRYSARGLHPGRYYVCFNRAIPSSRTECYGQTAPSLSVGGQPVSITAGTTTTVNLLWGPDWQAYLPLVSQP